MIPRSIDDLKRRHRGLRRIAECTVGHHGPHARLHERHLCRVRRRTRARGSAPRARTSRVTTTCVAYQKMIAREDLSLTHTIVHPTIDRVKDQSFAGNPVPLHKVGETVDRHRRARRAHPGHAGSVRRRDRPSIPGFRCPPTPPTSTR